MTAIAGCSIAIALVTMSGDIFILDASTFTLISQYSDSNFTSNSTYSESVSNLAVKKSDTETKHVQNDEIISECKFINDGKALLITRKSGWSSIFTIHPKLDGFKDSNIQRDSLTNLSKISGDNDSKLSSFVCHGSSNIFGLFEQNGHKIELFRLRSSLGTKSNIVANLTNSFCLTYQGENIVLENMHALKFDGNDSLSVFVHGTICSSSDPMLFQVDITFPFIEDRNEMVVEAKMMMRLSSFARIVFYEKVYAIVEDRDLYVYQFSRSEDSTIVHEMSIDDRMLGHESFSDSLVSFGQYISDDKAEYILQVTFCSPTLIIQRNLTVWED